jgi:hypothetical protein
LSRSAGAKAFVVQELRRRLVFHEINFDARPEWQNGDVNSYAIRSSGMAANSASARQNSARREDFFAGF